MADSRILVVEDEGIVAKDIEATLVALGYRVPGVAASGEDAVRLAAELKPDLVLMDVMLRGGMDGIEAAATIRKVHRIPVVYLTAYSDENTLGRAKRTEPFGYVVKPFQERELQTAVEMALYKHGMERRLEESRELLAVTLTSIGEAVIATDVRGDITFLNPRAEELIEWTEQEAQGRPLAGTVLIRDEVEGKAVFDITSALGPTSAIQTAENAVLTAASGVTRPVDATLAPIRNKETAVVGVVLTFRDVTERKKGEAGQKALLIAEQNARAEAQAANQAKDRFLATLSHELRTPLTAVLTWAQMIRQRNLSDEKIRHGAEIIERNAKAQRVLIDDLLDVSRIVLGTLMIDVREVPLGPVLQSAIDSIRTQADSKSIQLALEQEPSADRIFADPARLLQILLNLLSNAIKFTPPNGRVRMRAVPAGSSGRAESKQVMIEVSDTGMGIPPEFLPRIFDRFTQADDSITRRHGGLGLGLAIVKSLAELQHGSVEAVSLGQGAGSIFRVFLPAEGAEAATRTEERHPPPAPLPPPPEAHTERRRPRVLIVDDDPDARDAFTQLLCAVGEMDATAVGSVSEGQEAYKEWRPDVVVSDLAMPGMDGNAFLHWIRNEERATGARTRCVALTAYADETERACRAGFDACISKPPDADHLVSTIQGLARRE